MINFKTGLLICCGFTFAACGSKETKTPETPSVPAVENGIDAPDEFTSRKMTDYNKDLARFVGLEIGEHMESAKDKIKAHLQPEGESNISVLWEERRNGDYEPFTFSGLIDNMEDDSVKAQEVIAFFEEAKDGKIRLTEYGARIKCHRGENKNKWTTQPCP